MKLSMTILEHWIRKFEPVATIVSTEPEISGIRLFSYEKTPDPNYLYVGRTRDFFENASKDEVLLVFRKDVMSLNTRELEDVFDQIMDAFVYYQNWEQQMLAAFHEENPEQFIIDSCRDIFGPMFFMTMSLEVTAFSRQYPRGSVNPAWDDFWELGTLSMNSLIKMQGGEYMKKISGIWQCECFYEGNAQEYPYSMMITRENASHQSLGQLTIISKTPFEDYHRHLAVCLKRALCLTANGKISPEGNTVVQSLFLDFLRGKRCEVGSFHTFYQLQGWNKDNFCVLVLLKRKQGNAVTSNYDRNMLQRYYPDALYCPESELNPQRLDGILCWISLNRENESELRGRFSVELEKEFCQVIKKLGLEYFCSYPFVGAKHLADQYAQTKVCIQRGKHNYFDCALEDLANLDGDPQRRRLAVHPALYQMMIYDEKNKTDFYGMVKMYLRCERNRVLTAQKLYVHKNTLVYRLEKAVNLFSLHLDDPYEREYLLLSFRCLES